MSQDSRELRWFRVTFTAIGVLYILLASSMLVRGVVVLRDFGVPELVVSSPVMADFFEFFYQLMAAVGVLMILFGYVARELTAQLVVARAFLVLNLLLALRDLSTSDSRFGNHLYRGEATLVFVFIDLFIALVFGWLSLSQTRPSARAQK